MPESINPVLILTILGVVIIIALVIYIDPFGFKNRFKNTQENFDGLTALNNKIFEKMSPMATPNVVNTNKLSPDIPQNSAAELNDIIFPKPDTIKTPNVVNTNQISQDIPNNSANELNSIILPELVPPVKKQVEKFSDYDEEVQTFSQYENEIIQDNIHFELPELIENFEAQINEIHTQDNYITEQLEHFTENNPYEFDLPNIIGESDSIENNNKAIINKLDLIINKLDQTGVVEPTFDLPILIDKREKPILPTNKIAAASYRSENTPLKLLDTVAETIQNKLRNVTRNEPIDPTVENTGALAETLNINANILAGAPVSKNTGIVNTFTNTDVLSAFPLK